MGRPDRLCLLCHEPVQRAEEDYRMLQSGVIWSVEQRQWLCISCAESAASRLHSYRCLMPGGIVNPFGER